MQVGAVDDLASLYLQKNRTVTASDVSASSFSAITSSTATSSMSAQQIAAFEQQTGICGLDNLGTGLVSSLLSPDTRAQFRQQQEEQSVDGKPYFITGQESIARMVDVAASGSTNESFTNPAAHLTKDDFAFIRKTTGYNLVSSNDEMFLVDDNGNFPPEGTDTKSIFSFVDQMDMDRQTGTLTGSITKDYVEGLFARAKEAGSPYSDEFQQKVLAQFTQ